MTQTYLITKRQTYLIPKRQIYLILKRETHLIPNRQTYLILKREACLILKRETYLILRRGAYLVLQRITYLLDRDLTYLKRIEQFPLSYSNYSKKEWKQRCHGSNWTWKWKEMFQKTRKLKAANLPWTEESVFYSGPVPFPESE